MFPRLKRELKGKHWDSVENIQAHVTGFLRDVPGCYTWCRSRLFMFPRLKRELKGKHWDSVENIQAHVTGFLRGVPAEFQGATPGRVEGKALGLRGEHPSSRYRVPERRSSRVPGCYTWCRSRLFMFPRLKRELKGKHWDSVENIQAHVTGFLRGVPAEFQGATPGAGADYLCSHD
ncbi:hypothetical protein J6590_080800 [Homalodisca vitripennis]|nr:hypothetical protein J6590_080800 [Homalodisca vitripennis]